MDPFEALVAVAGMVTLWFTFISVAALRGRRSAQNPAALLEELRALREEMRQLRQQNSDIILQLDASCRRSEQRLERLEAGLRQGEQVYRPALRE